MDNRLAHFGFCLNSSSINDFEDLVQYHTNTTLRIDSSGACLSALNSKGAKRKLCDVYGSSIEVSSLTLGLGHPQSSSDSSKKSSATACTMSSVRETDDGCSMDLGLNFDLNLGDENICCSKKMCLDIPKPKIDLQLSLSIGGSESIITGVSPVSTYDYLSDKAICATQVQTVDEGSTSSGWNGSMLLPYISSTNKAGTLFSEKQIYNASNSVGQADATLSIMLQPPKCSLAASGATQTRQRNTNTKNCHFPGCSKGARGGSGLCIAHGGGRRCQKASCQKGAEGRTIFCKAHGGGRRCQHLGCTKSAEGRTEHCIAHGGGRRCSHEGCSKAARGKSGLCIRHGGGKRCRKENCTKSAEGHSSLCIAHGGGRRCKFLECTKGAQGSTPFCKAHGGGKRCTHLSCTKGAEGSTPFCKAHGGGKRCAYQGGCTKSVHGGTQFCVAHGGGKRCSVPECTRSARGKTDCCVRHGGGKRCKVKDCGKSAQGSTDFCKAHGGGKRCSWGQPESNFGIGSSPCERFARGKIGMCAAHSALIEDHRVHGEHQLLAINSENPTLRKSEKLKEIVNLEKENGNECRTAPHKPEGRVHGGSLMAMLANNASLNSTPVSKADCNLSGKWV
ncbi:uncharacterized protein LOC141819566 [Curcuma longa]|uniref:uncharacterized protein LOC141819566 n=1 Tax=Curcuma longa TaxID=136217 RepID=UPI003D9F8E93